MGRNPVTPSASKATQARSGTSLWDVDGAHSRVTFSIRPMMISNVSGEFAKVSGVVSFDEQDVTHSDVECSVEVASIDTREADRDGHLRSSDFFDATRFPRITFRSRKIKRDDTGHLTFAGDVTIRDATKPVSLTAEEVTPQRKDPWVRIRFRASARGRINRKGFGPTWNATVEGGGLLVGEQVKLVIKAEFIRREE